MNAAGTWASETSIAESKVSEWWADLEVNLKGSYLVSRAFLRLIDEKSNKTIINVGSWGMLANMPSASSYTISKLALGKLSEALNIGHPKVVSIVFHPGMISTDMANSHPEVIPFCKDKSK